MIIVKIEPDFLSWRTKARQLLSKSIHFDEVEWITEDNGFYFGEYWSDIEVENPVHVPRDFVDLAITVSTFRDNSTWSLLYRSLFRIVFEDKKLLENPLDTDVMELLSRARLVTRDMHKMKAFVRFKEMTDDSGESLFMAWHRPDHRIIRLVAPFFKDRFNGMKWVIMTEDGTATWDRKELSFSPGVPEEAAPDADDKEDLWKTYYRAIFNPARIKITAMKKELPVRHWKTLPETELITELIQKAPERLKEFYESQRKAPEVNFKMLDELKENLKKCRACGICEKATAPVPGLGPLKPRLMIIGEQPGDEEDLAGKPFVGPSGKLFNEVISKAGLRREDMYITNAVKGFKFLPKAHMRWHKGASISEITTCKPWLKKEIELVKPETIVCLGRSAALSVIGKMVKIEDVRGNFFESAYGRAVVIPHPASVLRNQEDQQKAYDDYLQDWRDIVDRLSKN